MYCAARTGEAGWVRCVRAEGIGSREVAWGNASVICERAGDLGGEAGIDLVDPVAKGGVEFTFLQHALVLRPVAKVAVREERLSDRRYEAEAIENRQQSAPHSLVRQRETIGRDDDFVWMIVEIVHYSDLNSRQRG